MKWEKVQLIPVSLSSNMRNVSAAMNVHKVELIPESNSIKGASMKVELDVPRPRPTNIEHVGVDPRKKRHPMTLTTLKAVKDQARKKGGRKSPNLVVEHFDTTDPGYSWLLPGWIAEVRFVPTGRQGLGRNYKYYYDPSGNMYYTRHEVLYAMEKSNIICLDI